MINKVANISSKNKKSDGMGELSPVRRTGFGILCVILSIFTFVALIDYNPSNYHTFPPDGDSPLLGQFGIILGRYAFAVLGLSAWLLPWFLGVCGWLCIFPSSKDQKLRKLIPFPFIILSICLLANLRDYQVIGQNHHSLFNQQTFEHGAGGSLGAWLYSGLPFSSDAANFSGGYLRIWIGEVGSWLLALVILFTSLAFHFSFNSDKLSKAFKLLGRLTSTLKFSKLKVPDKESPESVPAAREQKQPWKENATFLQCQSSST